MTKKENRQTTELEIYIRRQRQSKPILIMAHMVLGYPSFEINLIQIRKMIEAGVNLIELQIPFTEPSADGPIIVQANHQALQKGATVKNSFEFIYQVTALFPDTAFILMSYANILFAGEIEKIISLSAQNKIKGWIVPDLPPEEAANYLEACQKHNVSPIFIITPLTTLKRLQTLNKYSKGMLYAVSRKGVTGKKTDFTAEVLPRLEFYRKNISLPLAIGFGIQDKSAIDFLIGKADIAVIGTKLIEVLEKEGVDGVKYFLQSLSVDKN